MRHFRAAEGLHVDRLRQGLDLQRDALAIVGCEKIFEEKGSGAAAKLSAREELLEYACSGDIAAVWKIDCLGRSLRDLVTIVNELKERGIELQESIDTTTPRGS